MRQGRTAGSQFAVQLAAFAIGELQARFGGGDTGFGLLDARRQGGSGAARLLRGFARPRGALFKPFPAGAGVALLLPRGIERGLRVFDGVDPGRRLRGGGQPQPGRGKQSGDDGGAAHRDNLPDQPLR